MRIRVFILLLMLAASLFAANAVVTVGNSELFRLQSGVGELSPDQRALVISGKLKRIVEQLSFPPESIKIVQKNGNMYITARNEMLIAVTPSDTAVAGLSRQKLADYWLKCIRNGIVKERERSRDKGEVMRVVILVLYPVLLVLFYILLALITRSFSRFVTRQEGRIVKGIHIGRLELLSSAQETVLLIRSAQVVKFALFFIGFYYSGILFFRQFELTEKTVLSIENYTSHKLALMGNIFIGLLELTVGLLVLYLILRLLLSLINRLMQHYQEAETASGVVPREGYRALFIALKGTVIILFVFGALILIPGGKMFAFAVLVLFLLVVGLSFVSVVRDMIAGYIFLINREFDIGDRLTSDRFDGLVLRKTLLYTVLEDDTKRKILVHNSFLMSAPFTISKEDKE